MPIDLVDMVGDTGMRVLGLLAAGLSFAILLDEGLQHVLNPASSKLAGWLSMVNLNVATGLELSFGGFLYLLVAVVGLFVAVAGAWGVYTLVKQLWK